MRRGGYSFGGLSGNGAPCPPWTSCPERTRLPLSPMAFSATTPGHLALASPYWVQRGLQMTAAMQRAPQAGASRGQAMRDTRAVFWEGEGRLLRVCALLWHEKVRYAGRRVCVWCDKKRPAITAQCVICGDYVCFCRELL